MQMIPGIERALATDEELRIDELEHEKNVLRGSVLALSAEICLRSSRANCKEKVTSLYEELNEVREELRTKQREIFLLRLKT